MNDQLIINGITYRAVKEEPKKPREFWCCPDRNDDYRTPYSRPLHMSDEVHFVELPENAVIVTRKALEKARDTVFITPEQMGSFDQICWERFFNMLGFIK